MMYHNLPILSVHYSLVTTISGSTPLQFQRAQFLTIFFTLMYISLVTWLISFENLNDLFLHCFAANMMQNPKFGEAIAQNKRSGTARVKEKKDELVMWCDSHHITCSLIQEGGKGGEGGGKAKKGKRCWILLICVILVQHKGKSWSSFDAS
jgi:hypothetical protein